MASASYQRPLEIGALRDYVTGSSSMQRAADSTVQVYVTHNHLKAQFPEIRLDLHMTVDAVKRKVNTMCGTAVSTMVLQLKDEGGRLVALLADDARKLGFYSPRNGWTLHVIDTDETSLGAQGWLEDVSKVEKYVMSDEDYAKRDNTYKKFKEAKLKEDPSWTLEKEMAARRAGGACAAPSNASPAAEVADDYQQDLASTISVGERCIVQPGDRRGEVKYVGQVQGLAAGFWVGVAYDEPLGKNDGSVKGQRLFECQPGHGAFVRPDKVTAGDFPPLDDFSDLGSDDEI